MKTKEAIEYFGTRSDLARAVGVTPQSVDYWGDEPPPLRQIQLEKRTKGALKASEKAWGKVS
jgi:hypothetical protein